MLGIYLSGTGNTKHCIEKLTRLLDEAAEVLPLEDDMVFRAVRDHDTLILGYPTQFSNVPYMVRNFIKSNAGIWKGKRVLCVATMGAFSGDGAGCAARLLKRRGAEILGGLHIRMPDSVCDSRLLKKPREENRRIIVEADRKIERVAEEIRRGRYPREGISLFSHAVGLFGQRLWFYRKTSGFSDQLKINGNCIGCGLCAGLCPMKNIVMRNKRAIAGNQCTMCYRCISHCPGQAITLLGDAVREQCRYDMYVS